MKNQWLEREIKENQQNHELFTHQRKEDLKIGRSLIEKESPQDILVELKKENILDKEMLYEFALELDENEKVWDHFVAIETMKATNQKYPGVDVSDLESEEFFLKGNNREAYLAVERDLITKEEVFETIEKLGVPNLRIHFFIDGCYSSYLTDALSAYLADNLAFHTMIYSDAAFYTCQVQPEGYSNKVWLWSVYDYVKFDRDNKGIQSSKMRTKKILPDKGTEKTYV